MADEVQGRREESVRHFTVGDLFTEGEIRKAKGLSHQEILDQIVTPEKMKYLERVTGQENNRRYMAYMVEHLSGRLR